MLNDTNFVLLQRVLDAASLRHRVIAHNLANVNTPGFRRQEVRFSDRLAQAIASGDAEATGTARIEVRPARDPSLRPDGSNVSLEREVGDLMKNALVYQTVTQLLSARVAAYRAAITGDTRAT
jgi:flagellar basal-body rod protein FlgB